MAGGSLVDVWAGGAIDIVWLGCTTADIVLGVAAFDAWESVTVTFAGANVVVL